MNNSSNFSCAIGAKTLRYAKICFDIVGSHATVELYNDDGAYVDGGTYNNVKFIEISGTVRIDVSSIGMGKNVICMFAENVKKWNFTEGVLKIG
ncbi:MAG: hypothetical protein QW632_02505 [Ignisphaera sp.]